MDILEAMEKRHAVRAYIDKPIPSDIIEELNSLISECNRESALNMQLVTNEKSAFDSFMAHYGKFSGVENYIAIIGKKSPDLDEKAGYYGEKIVLKAQTLGLNSCWVAMTFSKRKCKVHIAHGEKLVCVIALGYGKTEGVPHTSRKLSELCNDENGPDWFLNGVKAAMLAPTAVNQQKFRFSLKGTTVFAQSLGGFYSKIDLGIAKYHFEVAAGKEHFSWG